MIRSEPRTLRVILTDLSENNKCRAFCIIFIVIWIKVATTTAITFEKYKWWVYVINWFVVTLIWVYTHFMLTSVNFSILLDITLNVFLLISDVCLCLDISGLWGRLDFFAINFVFKFLKFVIEVKCFLTVLIFVCNFIDWQCTSFLIGCLSLLWSNKVDMTLSFSILLGGLLRSSCWRKEVWV